MKYTEINLNLTAINDLNNYLNNELTNLICTNLLKDKLPLLLTNDEKYFLITQENLNMFYDINDDKMKCYQAFFSNDPDLKTKMKHFSAIVLPNSVHNVDDFKKMVVDNKNNLEFILGIKDDIVPIYSPSKLQEMRTTISNVRGLILDTIYDNFIDEKNSCVSPEVLKIFQNPHEDILDFDSQQMALNLILPKLLPKSIDDINQVIPVVFQREINNQKEQIKVEYNVQDLFTIISDPNHNELKIFIENNQNELKEIHQSKLGILKDNYSRGNMLTNIQDNIKKVLPEIATKILNEAEKLQNNLENKSTLNSGQSLK